MPNQLEIQRILERLDSSKENPDDLREIISELLAQSERLQNIIQSSRVGTWEWNVQTGDVIINDRYAEMLGYTKEELEPLSIDTWYQLVHPDDKEESDEILNSCFRKEVDFYDIECRLIHKSGKIVWINDRGTVVEWTKDGKPLIMCGTHADITNRKNTEVQFHAIADNVPGAVFRYTLDKHNTDKAELVSKGAEQLWGYTPKEIEENLHLIWERIDKRDVKQVQESINKSKEDLTRWVAEYRYHHPNGSIKWIRGLGNPTRLENGDTVWDTFLQDVNDRKAVELEIKENDRLLNEAQRLAKMGNWNHDVKSDEISWSDALYEVYGIGPKDFKHTFTSFLSLVVPEDRDFVSDACIDCKENGGSYSIKYRVLTASGDRRVIQENGFTEKDKKGNVIRMFGTAQDITENVKTTLELQKNTYLVENKERKRISQALHDGLQQTLIASLMRFNTLEHNLEDQVDKKTLSNLQIGIDMLKQGIEQTRSIAHQLVPPEIEQLGFNGAIEELVKKYVDLHLEFDLYIDLPPSSIMSLNTEAGIYRIIQEGINNVIKHAKASKCTILITKGINEINLTISDNGIGITKEKLKSNDFGVTSIQSRVKSLGGSFNIYSVPNKETTLKITIPVDP